MYFSEVYIYHRTIDGATFAPILKAKSVSEGLFFEVNISQNLLVNLQNLSSRGISVTNFSFISKVGARGYFVASFKCPCRKTPKISEVNLIPSHTTLRFSQNSHFSHMSSLCSETARSWALKLGRHDPQTEFLKSGVAIFDLGPWSKVIEVNILNFRPYLMLTSITFDQGPKSKIATPDFKNSV